MSRRDGITRRLPLQFHRDPVMWRRYEAVYRGHAYVVVATGEGHWILMVLSHGKRIEPDRRFDTKRAAVGVANHVAERLQVQEREAWRALGRQAP